jgi:hypothetical protein
MLTRYELNRCGGACRSQRINLERRIARQIVTDALAAGYSLNLNNGSDESELPSATTNKRKILAAMFQTDQEHLLVYNSSNGQRIGWFFFVYGNDGWDVVNDYTVNLEPIMRNANLIADKHS